MSPQYGELRPLAAEIDPVVWGTPANFNGFCVLAALLHTALQYWALATLCRVEQRAPPIFGRAAITLGIGPHSSCVCFVTTRMPGVEAALPESAQSRKPPVKAALVVTYL